MIIVADNLHIVRPEVAWAVDETDPAPIQRIVRRCVAAGAEAIDINPGPLSKAPERKMTFLVETVRSVTDLPVLLDTTNATALEAGLKAASGTAMINGFSLEPRKVSDILPLARQYDADIVGYLLHPDSRVPKDEAERLGIAVELLQAASEAGVSQERLVIDPVVAPVMWEDGHRQAMAILSVLRNLPDLLGFPVRTIAGVSNLTTGRGPAEGKRLLEAAYLPMLAAAGLTMALMNVFNEATMKVARAVKALQDPKIFNWPAVRRRPASRDGGPRRRCR